MGCLGIAVVEVMGALNLAEAGNADADVGAAAVLGLVAAMAAVGIGGFLVAQAVGAVRDVPGLAAGTLM